METETFEFSRPARRPAGYALVAAGLAVLAAFIFVIEAHVVVVAIVAVLVAPALWDLLRKGCASFRIDDAAIHWQSGSRAGSIPLADIDEAKLATTLDFSQRATLLLKDGRKVRIPPECLPGGRILDAELDRRGIRNRRSLFSF